MNKRFTPFLLLLVLLGSCQPHLQLTASYKLDDNDARKFSKLAILVLTPKESTRANLEEAIATLYRTKGIKAVSTFTMFPLANRMNEIELDLSEEERAEEIRKKINDREIDGLMIISLLNSEKETRYVQGASLTVGAPSVVYDSPIYNQPYSGYYSYAVATVYGKGYYETDATYFIEANLYETKSESLFYTAQVTLKNPDKVGEESEKFAEVIVRNTIEKKVLDN